MSIDMSWIKSIRDSLSVKDIALITAISGVLFLLSNVTFAYLSPSLIPLLPKDFIRGISPCYRSLFHFDLSNVSRKTKIEVVFGDSFSEGSGDEYLSGNKDYGIFRKIPVGVDRTTLIYGRSGYGNLGTLKEALRCEPLLQGYTSLRFEKDQVDRVTFVFYEGNDLDNNLNELERGSSQIEYGLRFFLPFADYAYHKSLTLLSKTTELFNKEEKLDKRENEASEPNFPITSSGIAVLGYPQSAALELTPDELERSVGVLRDSLQVIDDLYPESQLQFLYLPSVASSYEFSGVLPVQSYKGKKYHLSTGSDNEKRSREIRSMVEKIAEDSDWRFCDATLGIRNISSRGVAVYGLKDWKHLNKIGYQSIAKTYLECFPFS